ncbi:hypothetical protein [Nonomuraea sp. GTA35]|uniref:hypothetical protein n=1 Tax=Nonomuraea sp. GTA35 TaxID=1676746 RepID=UPI0035C1FD79
MVLLRLLINFGGYPGGPYLEFSFASWDPGPMWFAEVLIVFALGCVAHRRGWFDLLPARAWLPAFCAAFVSSVVLLPASLPDPPGWSPRR